MNSVLKTVARVAGHLVGVTLVGLALALATIGTAGTRTVYEAIATGQIAGSPWSSLALHVVLSVSVWGFVAWGFGRLTRRESKPRVVKLTQGTALTEFLIILVPFLLLTSGLAQLAVINTAGLLADVAIYNATRVVWIWEPRPGVTVQDIELKARTAAALALAPSAPSDYVVEQAPQVRDLAEELGGGGNITGPDAVPIETAYFNAFDTGSFAERTTKKLYFAFLATDIRAGFGDPISARMTYQMNVVFPWFAYIWGDYGEVGGRKGFYLPMRRASELPAQMRPVP